MTVLSISQWPQQREACLVRLRPAVDEHLKRASRHEKHPVMDFLFQYYSFRPAQLLAWSPGVGVVLENGAEFTRLFTGSCESRPGGVRLPDWLVRDARGWQVDTSNFPEKRRAGLEWVIRLLEAVQKNPPRFGCHGLHEWAMVYKASDREVRHYSFPLRLPMEEIEELINAQPVQCTHYDAFRFFMPEAVSLNRFQPTRNSRPADEQSGCIHVNMDHYKWAYKYYPWISTQRIAEAFELAVDARSVDMRASPYDLRSLGYEPIRIETPEGREQYQAEQRRLQQSGSVLRSALLKDLKQILERIQICA